MYCSGDIPSLYFYRDNVTDVVDGIHFSISLQQKYPLSEFF